MRFQISGLLEMITILLLIIFISCRNAPKPSIVGKWRIIMDSSYNQSPNKTERRYFLFDSNNYYYIREVTETSPYRLKGDTFFTRPINSNDTALIDTTIIKMINNDSVLVKVSGRNKANAGHDWYFIREK